MSEEVLSKHVHTPLETDSYTADNITVLVVRPAFRTETVPPAQAPLWNAAPPARTLRARKGWARPPAPPPPTAGNQESEWGY